MKKTVILISMLFFVIIGYSQEWKNNLPKNKNPKELTLYDYQDAFNQYWDK